jgi:hypothetical protein
VHLFHKEARSNILAEILPVKRTDLKVIQSKRKFWFDWRSEFDEGRQLFKLVIMKSG